MSYQIVGKEDDGVISFVVSEKEAGPHNLKLQFGDGAIIHEINFLAGEFLPFFEQRKGKERKENESKRIGTERRGKEMKGKERNTRKEKKNQKKKGARQ